jgi:hypothetical protein
MKSSLSLSFCLVASISLGTALAQTSTTQAGEKAASSSSPVAYVYVTRPTHVDGFAASSSGKLTPVPGSPFADIALSHLSVTKKFLFGASDDESDIYTYSIASDGALKQVSEVDVHKYGDNCYSVGPTQLDSAGKTLYNDDYNCDGNSDVFQSFKIEENGDLQYLATTYAAGEDYALSAPVVLGNNKYAYVTGTYGGGEPGGFGSGYKRESNGVLEYDQLSFGFPATKDPSDFYTPFLTVAADATDHFAVALQDLSGDVIGPVVLASYTAGSDGKATTSSTYENMPSVTVGPQTMSISPSSKLLAVGGGVPSCSDCGEPGFQVFHFNGSSPITHYTGVLQSGEKFVQFAWDSENHLYALSSTNLHVYEATSTEIKEVSGSPYSIPEASSLIVLSLK